MPRPYLDAPTPIAFAHRGGAKLWPENTLTAFQGAIDLGIRHIETDLHRTRDGVIVCFHDERLERTTDGLGPIARHTHAELERLDAGHGFQSDDGRHPFRGQGIRIPTFDEALALHPEVRFNVEIKQADPPMERALLDFIRLRGIQDRVLVAAAKDATGHAFRAIAGDRIATSPGLRGVVRFWLGVRTGLHRFDRYDFDALQVPVSHGGLTVVDGAFIEAAHRHGLHVHVWTIDDAIEMRRLIDLGVDGIMSDRPDVLLRVLAEANPRTMAGAPPRPVPSEGR